jgi:excinuclease ABC subunit C
MRETLKFACGLFQVRTCHLDLPEQNLPRPCLDYQIGRCTAPCVDYDPPETYRRRVRQLIHFLEGADQKISRQLQAEMTRLAKTMNYEEAAQVRDRLRKLERTVTRSRTVAGLNTNLDACGVVRDGSEACGVVLRVRRGRILTSHHFHFHDRLQRPTPEFLVNLLREYYPRAGDIPAEVLVSHAVDTREAWQEWLTDLRGKKVRLRQPRRGLKREVVEMAKTNATFKLGEHRLRSDSRQGRKLTPADVELQETLQLHSVPETIECFDISNFQGREAVGSLVFYRRGAPLKKRYRRFRIKTVSGIDDYAMMAEILSRYYERLATQEERPADLVVVDGGAGQLAVAREALTRFGFHDAQVIGLAKREETIHREHGQPPLQLSRSSAALKLLQQVRDEAHRFAITYHRLLRDQRTTASILDQIPGIGRIKKLSLLHHFGSVTAIRQATGEELGQVRGLNRRDVASILTFFERQVDSA